MSCEEHLKLSSYIKKIHKDLRTNAESLGVQRAWSEHCKQESALKEYADCMKRLATEHWDKKHKNDVKNSRNAWIINQINEYFTDKILLVKRQKELNEREKNALTCSIKTSSFEKPFSLLDVGSCYNPFKNIDNIVTTAIDICPASSDVIRCDFINLNVCDNTRTQTESKEDKIKNIKYGIDETNMLHSIEPQGGVHNQDECQERTNRDIIKSMHKESFDVVVFSLLLEYIPCSRLRFQCCVKAYHLMKHEGILIIITPDSKHQTSSNVQIMKKWKQVLQEIGFRRIKYEKLTHIHCMVFRKSIFVLELEDSLLSQFELLIPQDISKQQPEDIPLNSNTANRIHQDGNIANDFTTLPSFLEEL